MKNEVVRRWSKIVTLACVFYGIGNLYQPTVVVGNSMAPTLGSGKVIWIDRTYYKSHIPRRGEVIVFKHDDETLVKRVYRGPGETVHFASAGSEWVGPIRENQVDTARQRYERPRSVVRVNSLTVPEDSVFVLGDNFTCSIDSRHLGPIPLKEILGRAHLEADPTVTLPWEFVPRTRRSLRQVRHSDPTAKPAPAVKAGIFSAGQPTPRKIHGA